MGDLQKKLFLIPCCKRKQSGGKHMRSIPEPLENLVSQEVYLDVIKTRKEILSYLRQKTTDSSSENKRIRNGSDFSGQCTSGLYLPARERYRGKLYFNAKALLSWNDPDTQILILSALYGPLHPLSPIQNYDLKMSNGFVSKIWRNSFAPFLRSYVCSNGIREIYLFFGRSTKYLEVSSAAVKPLLENGLITKAIHYHVSKSNSHKTPTTHGKLLEKYLTEGWSEKLIKDVKACPL